MNGGGGSTGGRRIARRTPAYPLTWARPLTDWVAQSAGRLFLASVGCLEVEKLNILSARSPSICCGFELEAGRWSPSARTLRYWRALDDLSTLRSREIGRFPSLESSWQCNNTHAPRARCQGCFMSANFFILCRRERVSLLLVGKLTFGSLRNSAIHYCSETCSSAQYSCMLSDDTRDNSHRGNENGPRF